MFPDSYVQNICCHLVYQANTSKEIDLHAYVLVASAGLLQGDLKGFTSVLIVQCLRRGTM